jgi:hypothetical protein
MIRISEEHLDEGLEMAEAAACARSFHCLWGEQAYLPRENCCGIIAFREIFESDSPALFGKFLKLSEYKRIVDNFTLLELGVITENLQQIRKIQVDLHDLHVFTQGFLLVFYPLFLANGEEIPFLSSDEIKKEEKEFSKKPFRKMTHITGRKMAFINRHWFEWVKMSYLGSLIRPKKYTRIIALLVELLLAGMQKSEIPDILKVSSGEKEKFFQELKKELF